MNRTQLHQLAEDRVLDAEALLATGRWSGAYYLAGYAIECGLKACVLAYIERTGVIFQDRRFAEKCWTHDVETLVKAADLEVIRGLDMSGNPALALNWQHAKDWAETARYEQKTEVEARRPYEAVTDSVNGVLPWIKTHW